MPQLRWLTNIPAPYRVPLWHSLAARTDLQVLVLSESEPNRQWDGARLAAEVDAVVLGAPRLRLGADTFLYAPNRRLLAALREPAGCLVIDGWESPAYLLAVLLAHRRGSPVVLYYRGTGLSHRFRRGPVALVRRALFRRADAVLTGGPSSTRAVQDMGVDPARVVQGLNVVDVGGLAQQAGVLRQESSDGHRFLVVGQLIPRKNLPAVVAAFAAVRADGDQLTFVGDGPDRAALQAHANELDVPVTFTGHLEGAALTGAYAAADTLVLASVQEVYGLVVPEALACGLHAVVSTAAGCAEDVGDLTGVYLADPQADSLAAAMVRSRSAWRGPVSDPPVLARTPDAMSERVLAAAATATAALASRGQGSRRRR